MSTRDLVTARGEAAGGWQGHQLRWQGPRLVLPVPGGRKPGGQVALPPAAGTRGVTSRATRK